MKERNKRYKETREGSEKRKKSSRKGMFASKRLRCTEMKTCREKERRQARAVLEYVVCMMKEDERWKAVKREAETNDKDWMRSVKTHASRPKYGRRVKKIERSVV